MNNTMTIKELSFLTQKQIREYVLLKRSDLKVPKKWTDKKSALAWVEKNLDAKPEKKTTAPKVAKVKTEKKKGPASGTAIDRRFKMAGELRKNFDTAEELSTKYGNKYKSVLDDLHAIRHNRNEETYLLKNEVLLAVNVGKSKVFKICLASQVEKVTEEIKESVIITE